MRHAAFLCSGSSCSKAFPLPCRNRGAAKETCLPKARPAAFTGQLSVYHQLTGHRWAHTLLPRTQKYFAAVISHRFNPVQIPVNARASNTSSFAQGWREPFAVPNTLWAGREKWPRDEVTWQRFYLISVAEHEANPASQSVGCSAPFLLHLVMVTARGMIELMGRAQPFHLWPETCHNHSALLDFSLLFLRIYV